MKQLIPQSKIDEAAKINAEIHPNTEIDFDERYFNGHRCDKYDSFKSGVKFALNEIQPLMIELLNWQADNYIDCITSLDGHPIQMWKNVDSCVKITSEQLLEEFINSKNK